MNITVTFRHVDASDSIRTRATEKIAKLQKFLRQPMTARVTVSLEKLLHMVEARISSGGEHYEAHDATEDMYASIDKVLDKLEAQIRGSKGVTRDRKRRASATLRRPQAEPAELSPRLARAKTPPRDAKVAKRTASAKSR